MCKIRSGLIPYCSTVPIISQAGRLGIHSLLRLASGTIVCIADGKVYRSDDGGASFSNVFAEFTGRRPLRMGVCQDNLGRVYLGEYFFNRQKEAVRLWRSDDEALSWVTAHTWPVASIRHIHFVQFDPYGQSVWLGTGDEDNESQICVSTDGGQSFDTVGRGTQLWRAGSVLFTSEAVYWGTDIGIDHNNQLNYIMKYDRKTGQASQIRPIPGPTYYCTELLDGTLVIGTCVEQVNNLNGSSPSLLWSKDLKKWEELELWPKLKLPNVIGPATITFPLRDKPLKSLVFNANLTQKFNGALFELNIQ